MSPTTDAHEYALDEPLARTIIGERRHLSAYEVRFLSVCFCSSTVLWRPFLWLSCRDN